MAAVVIDTASANTSDPLGYWRDAASRVFQPLQVRSAEPGAFWARSIGYELCDLALTRTVSEAATVTRTPRAIAEFDPEAFVLVMHLRGRLRIAHDDRTETCASGDLAVIDSARPFRAVSAGPTDVVTVTIGKSQVLRSASRAARTALVIPGDVGTAGLLRTFLGGLLDGLGDRRIAPNDASVADSVVSLVQGLLDPRDPRPLPAADPLDDIKRYIDAHLGDPGLTPDRIAAAHFVSRRRLYTLFEREECGVREWIRSRRLERCRRDLRDPARRDETLLTIALRWGFTDPSHFSHSFRDAYGVSPRDFRAAAHSGTSTAHA